MSATNTILTIVNEAYLLPFMLTETSVTFGEGNVSNRWPGANSQVDIVGTGEGSFKGVFTVYYNRFDLSQISEPIEVLIDATTTLDDVLFIISDFFGAFEEELHFDVDTIPALLPGESVIINLIANDGSVAYFNSVLVKLTYDDSLDGLRLMEDGSVRLMEDGSPRLME